MRTWRQLRNYKKREESDYSAKIRIDRETAEKIVEGAEKFNGRMKEYLIEKGGLQGQKGTAFPRFPKK